MRFRDTTSGFSVVELTTWNNLPPDLVGNSINLLKVSENLTLLSELGFASE